MDADTGATPGEAIRATHTVTFAYPKLGQFLFPGAACVGKLHVVDIGFDWDKLDPETPFRLFTLPGMSREIAPHRASSLGEAAHLLQKRYPDANKGDYGHVAVVAGSRGMCGAPALVARAAQHAGAGLVTVLVAAKRADRDRGQTGRADDAAASRRGRGRQCSPPSSRSPRSRRKPLCCASGRD